MMLGSQELVLKTIKSFVFDFACAVDEIQTLLQKQDFDIAKRKLHTLKGCASDFGANHVAMLASDIEDILRYHGDTYQKMLALFHAWRVIDATTRTMLL